MKTVKIEFPAHVWDDLCATIYGTGNQQFETHHKRIVRASGLLTQGVRVKKDKKKDKKKAKTPTNLNT